MTPVLVITTIDDTERAAVLAGQLVEKKLAACVNVSGPFTSYYEWQGRIEHDTEVKLFIKSFREKWPELLDYVQKNHGYDVPELNMIEIADLNPDYLEWMHTYLG